MKETIARLVRLQELTFEIQEVEVLREAGPTQIQEIEQGFATQRAEIGAAKLRYDELTAERDRLREERGTHERRIEVAQQNLMKVTNQREYGAVLREIDGSKADLARVEKGISTCTEEIAQLEGPAVEAEQRIGEARNAADVARAEIEERIRGIDERLAELSRRRAEIVSALPRTLVHRFETIAGSRGGNALARIVNGACGACRMRIRPQVVSLVRRGEDIHHCESCRRILYIEPEAAPLNEAQPESAENVATEHGDPSASSGS